MNAKEVLELKEITKSKIVKITREYDLWIEKMQVISNRGYWIIGIALCGIVIYFKPYWHKWPMLFIVLGILIVNTVIALARREGHKEGYLDGYNAGFDEGVNNALGIDEESQELLAKIETDISLANLNKTP